MLVKELKELLATLPDDTEIVIRGYNGFYSKVYKAVTQTVFVDTYFPTSSTYSKNPLRGETVELREVLAVSDYNRSEDGPHRLGKDSRIKAICTELGIKTD